MVSGLVLRQDGKLFVFLRRVSKMCQNDQVQVRCSVGRLVLLLGRTGPVSDPSADRPLLTPICCSHLPNGPKSKCNQKQGKRQHKGVGNEEWILSVFCLNHGEFEVRIASVCLLCVFSLSSVSPLCFCILCLLRVVSVSSRLCLCLLCFLCVSSVIPLPIFFLASLPLLSAKFLGTRC